MLCCYLYIVLYACLTTLLFITDREATYRQCSKGTPVESWPVFAPGASIEDQREGASTEDQSLRFYMLSFNSINWLTISESGFCCVRTVQ